MNILFVSSGNKSNNTGKPGIVVYNQGESLKKAGINVVYFLVNGKGLIGYIKEGLRLREYLKKNSVDIIHAHYSFSGWVALIAFPKQPIILSLMGTDAYGDYAGENSIILKSIYSILLTYIIQPFIRTIICKSKHIQSYVYLKHKSHIIPNGVLLEFNNLSNKSYRNELGLCQKKKYILFFGDINNKRKNYQLLDIAFNMLDSADIELITPYPIPHEKVMWYLNSVDVLVVPSFMEGSPNIVKEAMVCNCPVVATNVGDIKWMFGNESGHYITSFEPEDVATKILQALDFAKKYSRTNGRKRIIELELDDEKIAKKIIEVYEKALDKT
jgi:teichuronic acid biosynthesis glycosyltransferase TuaC